MSDTPIFDEMLMDLPETHAVFALDSGAVLGTTEDIPSTPEELAQTEESNQ